MGWFCEINLLTTRRHSVLIQQRRCALEMNAEVPPLLCYVPPRSPHSPGVPSKPSGMFCRIRPLISSLSHVLAILHTHSVLGDADSVVRPPDHAYLPHVVCAPACPASWDTLLPRPTWLTPVRLARPRSRVISASGPTELSIKPPLPPRSPQGGKEHLGSVLTFGFTYSSHTTRTQ